MPTWTMEEFSITADDVMRGQGADPAILRQRSPKLAKVAERALSEGLEFVKPVAIYEKVKVKEVGHEKVLLENGTVLKGPFASQHLSPAQSVVVILCTVGDDIDKHVSEVMASDIVYGLALDGVGSAAVEALANAACKFIEDEVAKEGLKTTIPLSPGMVGWPVEAGQPALFEIIDASQINVKLTPYFLMAPRKSLSMVLGIGNEFSTSGTTCDFCTMRETCNYRTHYEEAQAL
jgi:hypothetical protein